MSFSKFILPVLMQFFSSRATEAGMSSQALFLNAVTDTVKKEISGLILKIAFGLVVTGVLIYSLVILGQHFHTYLLLYDNGAIYSVLFFCLLSITCVFVMAKLFYQKPSAKDPFESLFKGEKQFSVENLYSNFMSGLSDGLQASQPEEKTPPKKIIETKFKHSDTTH